MARTSDAAQHREFIIREAEDKVAAAIGVKSGHAVDGSIRRDDDA